MSSLETAKTAKKAKVVKFDPRLNEDRKFGCLFLPFFRFFRCLPKFATLPGVNFLLYITAQEKKKNV